jgi:RNA polymerase sigma-70 factor, ECF subfamily
LAELMPAENEIDGLLALMLLHDARRNARTTEAGELVLLEEQDRGAWDRAQIGEGLACVDAALQRGRAGAYTIQAAIAALHSRAPTAAETDWRQIAALYALLLDREPNAVVELNHAVAVAMVDGPRDALLLVEAIDARGELRGYHLLHAVRADLLRRLERFAEAAREYDTALELATLEPERRFLQRRITELRSRDSDRTRAESRT